MPVAPHDIDLGTDRLGALRIAARLSEFLIEPFAPTEWAGVGAVQGARAFVGTFRNGVRVEWAVTDAERRDEEWDPAHVRREVVRWRTRSIPVARLEYFVVRSARQRRWDRVDAGWAALQSLGVDSDLWARIASAELRTQLAARSSDAIGPRG